MRRTLLVLSFTFFALSAPAHATGLPWPEPLPPELEPQIYCSCPPMPPAYYAARELAERVEDSIAVEPQVDVQADNTRTLAVATYGEGATECTISLNKGARSFRGTTSCTAAIEQTALASTSGGASVTGTSCSGLRTSCTSSGTTAGDYTTLTYRVSLRAPAGQGWVASPQECSGAGTDNLECEFVF